MPWHDKVSSDVRAAACFLRDVDHVIDLNNIQISKCIWRLPLSVAVWRALNRHHSVARFVSLSGTAPTAPCTHHTTPSALHTHCRDVMRQIKYLKQTSSSKTPRNAPWHSQSWRHTAAGKAANSGEKESHVHVCFPKPTQLWPARNCNTNCEKSVSYARGRETY